MTAEDQRRAQQMLAGGHKPDSIATLLRVPVTEVEALQRRLQGSKAGGR